MPFFGFDFDEGRVDLLEWSFYPRGQSFGDGDCNFPQLEEWLKVVLDLEQLVEGGESHRKQTFSLVDSGCEQLHFVELLL